MDLANQSNRAGNSLLTDSPEIGTERTKTIPCLTAHPRTGHTRGSPPPRGAKSNLVSSEGGELSAVNLVNVQAA